MTNRKYFVVGFNGFNQFTNFIPGNKRELNLLKDDLLDDPPVDIINKPLHTEVSNEVLQEEERTLVVFEDNGLILRPMQLNVPDNVLFSWSSMFVFLNEPKEIETFGFSYSKLPQLANLALDCDFESSKEDLKSCLQDEDYVALEYADCPRGICFIPFKRIRDVVNWEIKEVFAVKDDGQVFTISRQQRNSNAVSTDEHILKVSRFMLPNRIKVKSVSCGKEHTIVLSEFGEVYSFGLGSKGQLGIGSLENSMQPVIVDALLPLKVKRIAAGGWHSIAVTDTGDAYAWGWNESGQLGIGCSNEENSLLRPKACDSKNSCKRLMVCSLPHLIDLQDDVIAVSCGSRHSAAVTNDNNVWSWGWNGYGQLGLGDKNDRHYPTKISWFLKDEYSGVDIVCNAWSTLIRLDTTRL